MCYYIYETIPPLQYQSYPTDEKQYFLDVDMYFPNTCLTPYIYSLASQPVTVDMTSRYVSIAPVTPVVERNLRPRHNSWSPVFVSRKIVQVPEGNHLEVKSAQTRGIADDEQTLEAEEGAMRIRGGTSEAIVLGLTGESLEGVVERSEKERSERKRKRVEKKKRLVSSLWGSRRLSAHFDDPLYRLQVLKKKRRNMSISKKRKVSNAEEYEERKISQPVARKFGPLRAVGRKISPLSLENYVQKNGSYHEETLDSDWEVNNGSIVCETPRESISSLSAGKPIIHGEEHDKYTVDWKTNNLFSLPDLHANEPFQYLTHLSQMGPSSLGHCSVSAQTSQPQPETLLRGGEPIPTYVATMLHTPEQFNFEPLGDSGKQEWYPMLDPRLSREDLVSIDMGAACGIVNEVVGEEQSQSQYESFWGTTKSQSLWDMMYSFPSDKFIQCQDEEGNFPIPHIVIPPPFGDETSGGEGGVSDTVLHYEDSPVAVEIPIPGSGDGLKWESEDWPGWDERDSPVWIEQDWGKWVEGVRGPYGCETF